MDIKLCGIGSRIFCRRTVRLKKKKTLFDLTETYIFSYGELSDNEKFSRGNIRRYLQRQLAYGDTGQRDAHLKVGGIDLLW